MNLYTGLLFQHGHIASPQLARALAADSRAGTPAPQPGATPGSRAARSAGGDRHGRHAATGAPLAAKG